MTSSATQTERPAAGQGAAGAGREAADRRERAVRWLAAHIDAVSSGVLLVGGWLLILFVNRWHVGAPSIFLCIGWLGILLAGRSLWRAASVAGEERPGSEAERAGFEVTRTRREDLEREKRALLKAIKEVEFDRDMGKMSEGDAAEIVRVYRGRAIEILKELDRQGEGGAEPAPAAPAEPIDRVIEREVRARLALAGVRPKKAKDRKAGGAKTEEAGAAKAEKAGGAAAEKAGGAKAEKAGGATAEKAGGATAEKAGDAAKAEKAGDATSGDARPEEAETPAAESAAAATGEAEDEGPDPAAREEAP